MSVRVHLVRHGRASGGWDDDPDPGLDDVGEAQARAVAAELAPLGPLPIVTSPMRRCRETSQALAVQWQQTPLVDPRVTEIPSPHGVPMGERVPWLRQAMEGTWSDLGPRFAAFRDDVVAAVSALAADTVVFSHFIAINAVIGVCLGDDRLVIRSLDNCSVTTVEVRDDDGLVLVSGGNEADTLIR